MYKVTADGKTMVGCNQDAWRTTTIIWFEQARNETEYGVCMTGSRRVAHNKFAPQSGMNEAGLVFSRLVAYHPKEDIQSKGKKTIVNEVEYLTGILHNCRTIDEVRKYVDMYDQSFFENEVFIYIDQSGRYLIVEPYKLIEGNDPTYVLSNFCPSITSKQNARKQNRYRDGEAYLETNPLSTSLDFCRSVSDTMAVCRNRNGDGTLLTSIWDTQKGLVNLYFYHSYDTTIQFSISDELALGNQMISIPELFPNNHEFQRLIDYKTPFNVNLIRVGLAILGVLMMLFSFLFIISFIRKRHTDKISLVKLFFAGLNVLLFYYLFVLATNINIFYMDAPYQDYSSKWISLSSYTPFLLLIVFLPLTYLNFGFLGSNDKPNWIRSLYITNNAIYLLLIIAFGYWGLFDILN